MCFPSNFGCKIIFMFSVNFWHRKDSNSLFKGSIGHVTYQCKWPIETLLLRGCQYSEPGLEPGLQLGLFYLFSVSIKKIYKNNTWTNKTKPNLTITLTFHDCHENPPLNGHVTCKRWKWRGKQKNCSGPASSPCSSSGFYVSLAVQNGIVVMQSNGKEMYKNVCCT